jgi:hypothetical protein
VLAEEDGDGREREREGEREGVKEMKLIKKIYINI